MKEIAVEKLYEIYKTICHSKVCTDTRKIIPDSLFFALPGPRFNANLFVKEALNKGCKKAVCSDSSLADNENIFFSGNPLRLLQKLSNFHRKRFRFPVIAIGGSNGKTTHKELIHVVLSAKYRSVATRGNLNNHIGVPLTLLDVDENNTDFLVLEMGANHLGEYAELCSIAEPDYGLITNIGRDHLEGFGSLEGVRKGNGELYEYIRVKKGKIFLHTSDPVLREMAKGMDYVGYGTEEQGNLVCGRALAEDPFSLEWKSVYSSGWRKLTTHFTGSHYLPNVLSALCIGTYWKIPPEAMEEAIRQYVPSMNRSQKIRTERNEILLDAYNANPDSMRAAISSFLKIPHPNKWIILGDMFELGTFSYQEHQAICDFLKDNKFDNVVLTGREFYQCQTSFLRFENLTSCMEHFKKHPLSGAYVLLKGSRGMQLEKMMEVL